MLLSNLCSKGGKNLILQPIEKYSKHSKILVLVIAALAEYDHPEDIEFLIRLLGQLQALSSVRLRSLIT